MPRPSRWITGALLAALVACSSSRPPEPPRDYTLPLPEGAPALIAVPAGQWPDMAAQWNERQQLLPALQASIDWFSRPSSVDAFPVAGVDHERALESLVRFERALVQSRSAAVFGSRLVREFELYRSAGWDGQGGGVLFTGYCTPIVQGRLQRDADHPWPLYGLPADLVKGEDGSILGQRRSDGTLGSYPDRRAIETRQLLAGLELIWLADPLDAYLAHVNGSVVVRLEDGSLTRFGYAGKNGLGYTSLRAHLVEAGAVSAAAAGLPSLRAWAAATPIATVLDSLRKNPSFVFFHRIDGLPRGSMNLPVTAGRTLATDKSVFPRGGLVFVDTRLPSGPGGVDRPFQRFMLDQDTGGAIRSAGRADIYLGSGHDAERIAGSTAAEGQLYYLFARE
jgi:membrane-bound lytic murein transglycosylase A